MSEGASEGSTTLITSRLGSPDVFGVFLPSGGGGSVRRGAMWKAIAEHLKTSIDIGE